MLDVNPICLDHVTLVGLCTEVISFVADRVLRALLKVLTGYSSPKLHAVVQFDEHYINAVICIYNVYICIYIYINVAYARSL